MKTLLLMRHGKSLFKDSDVPDFERPLSKRGEKDSVRMGKQLKEKDLVPDVILSSTAVRAARSAEATAEKCGYKGEIVYINDLFLGEPETYLTALNGLNDEDTNTVLVVGHNPGLESLLQMLTDKVKSLPTGAVAILKVPVRSWKAVNGDIISRIEALYRPRELK